ncbi:MAG TPA: adenylate/guanylate cyclase domain-containing protein [Vicinamibacterales bacterium]|nr:adenylate/guanylate cyclase domain-containing protein [Vicinamibacterales bacterium]HOQ59630.1 adenylate/guanylate cyclase domain-containing protein [Vicinamibacterales bacterium]HPK70792.1 adenylate/guanylate cyclase domain-containing protein [Vicinamibacterales bacterium]
MRRSLCATLAIGCALGAAAAALAWALGQTAFLRTVELKTYDYRVRLAADPASARRDLVLVSIDDSSIRRLEPQVGRWPWPRLVHASLIDYLRRAPAKAIVYDVLFTERDRRTFQAGGDTWTGEESDLALATSASRAGNVVFAADVTADEVALEDVRGLSALRGSRFFEADPAFESRPGVILPYAELTEAAAAVGHSLTIYDADGPVRRTAPFVRVGTVGVPSIAVAAVMVAGPVARESIRRNGDTLEVGRAAAPLVAARIPSFYGPAADARRLLIRFTGPVLKDGRPTYADYSFYDLFYSEQQLLAEQAPAVDPAVFRDKIVVVGTTAAGLRDLFTVPFAEGSMPGMQVHANVIDNLLSGRFMRPLGRAGNLGVLLACALAVGIAGALTAVGPTLAAAALMIAGLAWASYLLIGQGVWIGVAEPVLGATFAAFGGTAYHYFAEGREKRRVKKLFSRFVSRDVYEQLLADPAGARIGGARREMSVLFADIRGFTALTERGQPEAVVAQLNEYFSAMVDVVFRHRGTIDKFVGDMVMALFGAPVPDADHADNAVKAALGMLAALGGLNAKWAAEGRPALDIGIGVNSGDMLAGNIGSDTIMSYTVIGDAVNLGARLESLNKEYGTRLIVSDATRTRLKGRYDLRPLGSVTVKGKSEEVAIFAVLPPS